MKYIIVKPREGLCNRMRTLVGAISLSKRLNRNLIILWSRDASLNCKFSELFSPISYKVIETKENSLFQKILLFVLYRLLKYKILDDEWVISADRLKDIYPHEKFLRDNNLIIDACQDMMRDCADYSVFGLSKKLSSIIEAKYLPNDIIGLHIRRADNEKSKRTSPTYMFESSIEKELSVNPKVKFYLATDDKEEEKYFLQKYGEKIVVHKKESLDRNNHNAICDAAIDLFCLARCKKIYGSYYSSFSDVAALIGGKEIEIIKNKDI